MKRIASLLLSIVLMLGFTIPAMAAESYADVNGDEWFAAAAYALRERGIMNGVEGNRFAPNETFTRAQLATVLYRMAGSPVVTGEDSFSDTEPGAWYADAVLWASQTGVVNGIGNGLYGTNDPTTQEQLAVMLWRNAGSYVLGSEYASESGAENDASAYNDMLPIATAEKNSNARPAIKNAVENFDEYDTVFIGYPIWWGDLPMILHTFMERYDFAGKTVIPFNTHEGSGQSGTQSAIANKLSGATVLQGLAMRGSTAQALVCAGTDATVKNWLDGLGLVK